MNKNTKTSNNERFLFKTAHFYQILESQGNLCPITGRELTPQNTVAEHRMPLRLNGKHELANIILVDQDAAKLKRYMSDADIVQLAADIIKTLGGEFGYSLRKK